METMLQQMGGAKDTEVHLLSHPWDTTWTCIFESKSNDSRLRIQKEADTMLEAVTLVYNEWNRITTAAPEFRKPLTYTPFEEVAEAPPVDDDIPY